MILTCLFAYIVLFSPTLLINSNVVSTIFHYAGVFVIVVVSAIRSAHPFILVSPASRTGTGKLIIHSRCLQIKQICAYRRLINIIGKILMFGGKNLVEE